MRINTNFNTGYFPQILHRNILSRDAKNTSSQKREIKTEPFPSFINVNKARQGFVEDFLAQKVSLMSDSKGKIKHIVFQSVGTSGSITEELINAYGKLIDNMESDVKFTFLASGISKYDRIMDLLKDKKNPERFKVIDTGRYLSIWTRDSMIPVKSENGTVILLPDRYRDSYYLADERYAAKVLKENNQNFDSQKLDNIFIDGGDILSGPGTFFVGEGSIHKTIESLKERSARDKDFKFYILNYYEQHTGKKVAEESRFIEFTGNKKLNQNEVTFEQMLEELVPEILQSKFGSKLYVLGKDDPKTQRVERQPVFHIDMCITPIDEKVALLADPCMALDIIKKLKNENPDEYKKQVEEFCRCSDMSVEEFVNYLKRELGNSRYNKEESDFEAAGRNLKQEGFKVITVPYLAPKVYMSYNNCLMNDYYSQEGRRIKQVFLPVYGFKALDDTAVKTYEDLGYEVIPLKFSNVAELKGALRCVSQVLEKSPTA